MLLNILLVLRRINVNTENGVYFEVTILSSN